MEMLPGNQLVVSLESLFLAGMYYLNMAFRGKSYCKEFGGEKTDKSKEGLKATN